jgi:hypothetical protein
MTTTVAPAAAVRATVDAARPLTIGLEEELMLVDGEALGAGFGVERRCRDAWPARRMLSGASARLRRCPQVA